MKRLLLLFACVLCLCSSSAQDKVFFVSRNLNRNIIVYDVQLKDGTLDMDEPLHVYWYNLEKNPVTTNELNFIQRKLAYGYTVEEQGKDEVTVKLKAYKKRPVKICRHNGKWVAIATINGKKCVLTEIYAHCPTKTSCDYMELRGKRLSDGKMENETVK
ncbi:MAG: DUF4833 domain-containing protein [Bacteroidaceae bacterium]|nr:DUF4833 domain-containing protein [Bacteroidaceae bacterium]